jgi:hypothetical protein
MAALAATFLAAAPASAQPPAEQAERLNDEGKKLFADKNYEGAYGKFREAATLSPEGRFFFNVCYALNFLERYEEAIQACGEVEAAGADAELIDKTRKALTSLREKAAAQGGQGARLEPTSGEGAGDQPTAGEGGGREGGGAEAGADVGGGGQDRPPGPPPDAGGPDPFVSGRVSAPIGSYKWSIGGTVGMLGNVDVGREVDNSAGTDQEVYGPGGADFRLFANFIVSEAARFGLQASLGFGALPPGEDNLTDDNLLLADIGGAIFFHLPLARHVFVTPLVGPFLSVQQPQELSQGFIAGGARAELGLAYVFGRTGEHALSLTPAINVYLPASGEVEGVAPEEFGLDLAHSTFGISAGYTYRFSTPFGSVPLITLE